MMRALVALAVMFLLSIGSTCEAAKRRPKATAAATTGDPVWDALLASWYGADLVPGTADDPLAVDWPTVLGTYVYDVVHQPSGGGGWLMFMSAPGSDLRYGFDPVNFPTGWRVHYSAHTDTGYNGDWESAVGMGLERALQEPSLDAGTFAVVLNGYSVWVAQHGVPTPR